MAFKLWCDRCEKMVVFEIEPMQGINKNGKHSGDIMCGRCKRKIMSTLESDVAGEVEISIK